MGVIIIVVTQDDLIKQISKQEDIDVATVRKVFKSAENCIFDYLSSTSPIENIYLKIFSGFNISRKYEKDKIYSKGMFKEIGCPEHVKVNGHITKYYKNKVNDSLF